MSRARGQMLSSLALDKLLARAPAAEQQYDTARAPVVFVRGAARPRGRPTRAAAPARVPANSDPDRPAAGTRWGRRRGAPAAHRIVPLSTRATDGQPVSERYKSVELYEMRLQPVLPALRLWAASPLLLALAQVASLSSATAARWVSDHEHVLRTVLHPAADALTVSAWDGAAANISMPLDHFDALASRSWSMRYWVDAQHWDGRSDPPVFLCMGGEGANGPPGGAALALAQEYRGLAFSVEHRYYGRSIPTEDFSTQNLRWLGTEQALADAALFVRRMNERCLVRAIVWRCIHTYMYLCIYVYIDVYIYIDTHI